MKIAAAEFKARCLALIDRVRERGEPITITKRGRVVARLVAADDDNDRPWQRLRGKVRWVWDPLAPAIGEISAAIRLGACNLSQHLVGDRAARAGDCGNSTRCD